MNAQFIDRFARLKENADQPALWAPSIAFLKIAIACMLGGSAIYEVVLCIFVPEQKARAFIVLILAVVALIAWGFLRYRMVNATVQTLCAGAWAYITLTSFFLGGVNGTAVVLYPLTIVLTGWLIGTRAAMGVAALTTLAMLGFVFGDAAGLLPSPLGTPPALRWVVQSMTFFFSATMIAHVVRSYRDRLEEVRRLGGELALLTAELQTREADLNHAQAVAHVGSWVYDLAADRIRLSEETCRILGLPKGTVGSYATYMSRVHSGDRGAVDGEWQTMLREGEPFEHEHRVVVGPEVRWVKLMAELEAGVERTAPRVVGTIQDITARKRDEEALRLMRLGVDVTSDALFWIAPDARIVDVNPAACRSLGYTREQMLQLRVPDFATNFDAVSWQQYFADMRRHGSFRFESEHRASDGHLFPVEVVCNYLLIGGEEYGCAFVRDIGERKRQEAALQSARTQMEATLEAIPDVLFEVGLDGRYYSFHSPRIELLVVPPEKFIGRTVSDVMPAAAAEICLSALREANAAGSSHGMQIELPLPTGRAWFELSVSRKRIEPGQEPRFIVLSRDITERKSTEEALRTSEMQMQSILGSTADGILAVDNVGNVIQTNARFAELWRIPQALLDAKNDKALLEHVVGQLVDPGAFIEKVEALYHSDAKSADTIAFNDGRVFDRYTAPLLLNSMVVGRVWSFRDVTARVHAESELRVQEERLRLAMEATLQGWFEVNVQTGAVIVSPEYARILGYDPATFHSSMQDWIDGIHVQERAVVMKAFAECLATGETRQMEYRRQTRSGEWKWIRSIGKVVEYDGQGKPLRMTGTHADISERRRVERNLSLAVEVNQVVIWELDLVNDRLMYDGSMLALLGLDNDVAPDSLRAWLAHVHPDDRGRLEERIALALQSGDPVFDFDYRMLNAAGLIQWIHSTGRVVQRDATGRPTTAVGTSTNITARKLAEEALLQSERRFRDLLQNVPAVAVQGYAPDGTTQYWNEASERLYGYSAQEAIGKDLLKLLVPPEALGEVRAVVRQMVESGQAAPTEELSLMHKNGSRVMVLSSHAVVRNPQGGLDLFCIDVDLTERMREAALTQLLESLARTTNEATTPLLAMVGCLERICAYGNWDVGHVVMFAPGQTSGMAPTSIWRSVDEARFAEFMRRADEYEYFRARGNFIVVAMREQRPVWIEDLAGLNSLGRISLARAHCIRAGFVFPLVVRGEIAGFLEFFAVTTRVPDELLLGSINGVAAQIGRLIERDRAEEALARLNRDLESRVAKRTADLEAANRELNSFSYTIAHDMRAPVRAINGFSEMVLQANEGKLDAVSVGHLKRVVAGSRHMGTLIDDLLNLARLSRQEMRWQKIDLSEMAVALVAARVEAQPERRVGMAIQPGLRAEGDGGLLRVVLDNLIGNAWKFTAKTAAARIEIGCVQQDGECAYFVRDNGAGFDMRYAHKLFVPFQRLHHTDEFEGTGIGLATVKKIIQRHGGRIWVDSAPNLGTTVYFTIGAAG